MVFGLGIINEPKKYVSGKTDNIGGIYKKYPNIVAEIMLGYSLYMVKVAQARNNPVI